MMLPNIHGISPMLLDWSRDECKGILRTMELKAYQHMVTVFRAQGELTKEKRKMMSELQQVLGVGLDRHKFEVRRAVNDEKAYTIAYTLFGGSSSQADWAVEGRRLVPLLPRAAPNVAYTALATRIAQEFYQFNISQPRPADTARFHPRDDFGEASDGTDSEDETEGLRYLPDEMIPAKFVKQGSSYNTLTTPFQSSTSSNSVPPLKGDSSDNTPAAGPASPEASPPVDKVRKRKRSSSLEALVPQAVPLVMPQSPRAATPSSDSAGPISSYSSQPTVEHHSLSSGGGGHPSLTTKQVLTGSTVGHIRPSTPAGPQPLATKSSAISSAPPQKVILVSTSATSGGTSTVYHKPISVLKSGGLRSNATTSAARPMTPVMASNVGAPPKPIVINQPLNQPGSVSVVPAYPPSAPIAPSSLSIRGSLAVGGVPTPVRPPRLSVPAARGPAPQRLGRPPHILVQHQDSPITGASSVVGYESTSYGTPLSSLSQSTYSQSTPTIHHTTLQMRNSTMISSKTTSVGSMSSSGSTVREPLHSRVINMTSSGSGSMMPSSNRLITRAALLPPPVSVSSILSSSSSTPLIVSSASYGAGGSGAPPSANPLYVMSTTTSSSNTITVVAKTVAPSQSQQLGGGGQQQRVVSLNTSRSIGPVAGPLTPAVGRTIRSANSSSSVLGSVRGSGNNKGLVAGTVTPLRGSSSAGSLRSNFCNRGNVSGRGGGVRSPSIQTVRVNPGSVRSVSSSSGANKSNVIVVHKGTPASGASSSSLRHHGSFSTRDLSTKITIGKGGVGGAGITKLGAGGSSLLKTGSGSSLLRATLTSNNSTAVSTPSAASVRPTTLGIMPATPDHHRGGSSSSPAPLTHHRSLPSIRQQHSSYSCSSDDILTAKVVSSTDTAAAHGDSLAMTEVKPETYAPANPGPMMLSSTAYYRPGGSLKRSNSKSRSASPAEAETSTVHVMAQSGTVLKQQMIVHGPLGSSSQPQYRTVSSQQHTVHGAVSAPQQHAVHGAVSAPQQHVVHGSVSTPPQHTVHGAVSAPPQHTVHGAVSAPPQHTVHGAVSAPPQHTVHGAVIAPQLPPVTAAPGPQLVTTSVTSSSQPPKNQTRVMPPLCALASGNRTPAIISMSTTTASGVTLHEQQHQPSSDVQQQQNTSLAPANVQESRSSKIKELAPPSTGAKGIIVTSAGELSSSSSENNNTKEICGVSGEPTAQHQIESLPIHEEDDIDEWLEAAHERPMSETPTLPDGQVQVIEEAMEVFCRGDKESARSLLLQAGITLLDPPEYNPKPSVLPPDASTSSTQTTEDSSESHPIPSEEIVTSVVEAISVDKDAEVMEESVLGSSSIRVQAEPSRPSSQSDFPTSQIQTATELFVDPKESSPSKDLDDEETSE